MHRGGKNQIRRFYSGDDRIVQSQKRRTDIADEPPKTADAPHDQGESPVSGKVEGVVFCGGILDSTDPDERVCKVFRNRLLIFGESGVCEGKCIFEENHFPPTEMVSKETLR